MPSCASSMPRLSSVRADCHRLSVRMAGPVQPPTASWPSPLLRSMYPAPDRCRRGESRLRRSRSAAEGAAPPPSGKAGRRSRNPGQKAASPRPCRSAPRRAAAATPLPYTPCPMDRARHRPQEAAPAAALQCKMLETFHQHSDALDSQKCSSTKRFGVLAGVN